MLFMERLLSNGMRNTMINIYEQKNMTEDGFYFLN